MKSAHSEDMARPCEGCGAIWLYAEGRMVWIMNHLEGCQYLEDLEYGDTREIANGEGE